jgi:hypothetical protein
MVGTELGTEVAAGVFELVVASRGGLIVTGQTMHPEATRLFALDEALRAEADRMLADSGIGAILADAGYVAVGS